MMDARKIGNYLLSAAALMGPIAYILFGFYENGRLGYFGAPVDFMQISSFGIIPVVTTVYPWILVTYMVLSLLSAVRVSSSGQKVVLVAGACTYIALVLFYVAMTPVWKWVFGLSALVGAAVALLVNRSVPDFGNEVPQPEPEPQHISIKYYAALKRYVLVLCGIAVFPAIFSALGNKEASTQEFFWTSGDGVVLGFYGDQVLIADRQEHKVGPAFRIVELKSLGGSLRLLRVGPLQAVPMWKDENNRR